MTIAARGLTVYVARPNHGGVDCTDGGVSATADRLTLVGILDETDPHNPLTRVIPPSMRVFEPTVDAPAALLRTRAPMGGRILVDVVPVAASEGGWYSNGGNLATWSDSRISETVRDLLGQSFYGALHIHDRKEW